MSRRRAERGRTSHKENFFVSPGALERPRRVACEIVTRALSPPPTSTTRSCRHQRTRCRRADVAPLRLWLKRWCSAAAPPPPPRPGIRRANAPEQIRLAATGAPGALLVTWATSNASSAPYAPVFWFSAAPDRMTQSAADAELMGYVVYGIRSPRLHAAVVTGVASGAPVSYSVVVVVVGAFSAVLRTDAPSPASALTFQPLLRRCQVTARESTSSPPSRELDGGAGDGFFGLAAVHAARRAAAIGDPCSTNESVVVAVNASRASMR